MKCKVITSNEFVAVVDYNGEQIQIPGSLVKGAKEVDIVVENGIAKLADTVQESKEVKPKRRRAKKAE